MYFRNKYHPDLDAVEALKFPFASNTAYEESLE
jgi:hypothetical protein